MPLHALIPYIQTTFRKSWQGGQVAVLNGQTTKGKEEMRTPAIEKKSSSHRFTSLWGNAEREGSTRINLCAPERMQYPSQSALHHYSICYSSVTPAPSFNTTCKCQGESAAVILTIILSAFRAPHSVLTQAELPLEVKIKRPVGVCGKRFGNFRMG